jgi:lipopolysaccharide export system permease protein
MTLGRLYQDQEMTVLQSSGLGLGKVRRMVILVAIPMALISSWLMLWVYPVSASIAEDLKNQHQEALLLAAMGSGRFYEARDGKLVFYAESSDSGGLRNLFIQVEKRDGISLVTAEKGSHYVDPVSGLRHVVLHDGREYNGSPGSNDFSALKFDEYEIAVNAPEQKARSKRPKHMHTTELLELGNLEASVELQSRLVFPLSVIAFGLLAIPLSRSSPRKSSYLNVVLAVVLYLIFMALLKSADQWMLRKMTPEWLGMWWVVALMLLIALFLDNYDTLRFRRVARKQRAQA